MELWMKIGTAVLLGLMIFVLFPQAKHMMKHSPEAQEGDWASFLLPVLIVAGFVGLLMWLV